jgi:hypothetical protein
MDVDKLIERYPTIYHMAESASWPSIREHGLLSASEVLRRAGSPPVLRSAFRAEKVSVQVPEMGVVVLRDQKPMSSKRLEMAFTDDTSPGEWYRLINDRVFFWAQEERLLGLLNAKEYRDLEHDVLTVDTGSLLAVHGERVSLCHMNSGNTFPIPHHRGRDAFRRIANYPVKKSGRPVKEVVEVTVDDHVLDIAVHVRRVRRMRGATVLGELPLV